MKWDEWRGSMDGKPTLWVRHLLCGMGFHIDLHKMVSADGPECFHTHPAWAFRFVLFGGYVEEIEDGTKRVWFPFRFGIVAPSCSHRIAALRNGKVSVSLWVRWRKTAKVRLRGSGWQAQQQIHRAANTEIEAD